MAPSTRVLFIGGEGRSGSTVLERLIAASPGTCAVGELKNLFERGVGHRELCGCGRAVVECELWSEVGRRLVGGWDTEEGRELVQFFTRVNHRLQLPVIVSGRGEMVARARSVLSALYPMVAELTGSSVIVDSSKHPAWAYLLAGTDGIDLRVVHLVRHPSGVVHSWGTPVARPQAGEGLGDQLMPAHSPLEVSVRWDVFNGLFHHLAKRPIPTVLVRYEDYVEDINGAVRVCLKVADLSHHNHPATMSTGHGIAGNPSRFATAGVEIVRDEQWVTQLGSATHAMVSVITLPIRTAYGYRYRRVSPVGRLPTRSAANRFVPTGHTD